MGINKVTYGNDVLVDLTSDTVTPNTLLSGETAHDNSGTIITGALEGLCKFTIPSFSSLPITVYNPKITADHEVIYFYLSNSSAQTSEWDATFADGSVTISGSINGSTTLLLKVAICEELTVTTS